MLLRRLWNTSLFYLILQNIWFYSKHTELNLDSEFLFGDYFQININTSWSDLIFT